MKSFVGITVFAAIALFGLLSIAEAMPEEPVIADGEELILNLDLEMSVNIDDAVDRILDAVIAKLLPYIVKLLPIIEYLSQ